jgi:hypothetical protein
MCLNVGGAVLGVAVLTVIADSVTVQHGGSLVVEARLRGYQAAYYGAVAWAAIGTVISLYSVAKHYLTRGRNDDRAIASVAGVDADERGSIASSKEKSAQKEDANDSSGSRNIQ